MQIVATGQKLERPRSVRQNDYLLSRLFLDGVCIVQLYESRRLCFHLQELDQVAAHSSEGSPGSFVVDLASHPLNVLVQGEHLRSRLDIDLEQVLLPLASLDFLGDLLIDARLELLGGRGELPLGCIPLLLRHLELLLQLLHSLAERLVLALQLLVLLRFAVKVEQLVQLLLIDGALGVGLLKCHCLLILFSILILRLSAERQSARSSVCMRAECRFYIFGDQRLHIFNRECRADIISIEWMYVQYFAARFN